MRVCMFCDSNKCSKEHVWPKWLREIIPSENARIFAEVGEKDLGNWPASNKGVQVRQVCATCNNVWMSNFESKAKPVIKSILSEETSELPPSDQAILARWAVKTAMVHEAVDSVPSNWFYSRDQRSYLRQANSIPEQTEVLIAKCDSHEGIYCEAKNYFNGRDDMGFQAHVTTMVFVGLALQVVTIRIHPHPFPNVAVTYDVSDHRWESVLTPVWPLNAHSVLWPPKCGLNGRNGIIALRDRLTPTPAQLNNSGAS